MKLKRLILTGFGKFSGREIELGEGLNLIYGVNESGKTTLQNFLKGMLYGFKEPDAKRRQWRIEHAKYEPWDNAPYQGVLEFLGADGRMYRVERDFARRKDSVTISDALTGKDLSANYDMDQRRELLFAERHTGMNELVFQSTVCIDDVPGGNGEKGEKELAARLANLQESGDEEISVRQANLALEKARRTQVTRLNRAKAELEQAANTFETIAGHRQAVRALERELVEADAELTRLKEMQNQTEAAVLAVDITVLRQRLQKVADLQKQVAQLQTEAASLAHAADFPVEIWEQVKELEVRREEAIKRQKVLAENVAALDAEVADAKKHLIALPGGKDLQEPGLYNQTTEKLGKTQLSLAQLAHKVETANQSLVAAEDAVDAIEVKLQEYSALAALPTDAPRIVASLQGVGGEACATLEALGGFKERNSQLVRRVDRYKNEARQLLSAIEELSAVAKCPANSKEQLKEWAAEAQALTETAKRLYATGSKDRERAERAQGQLELLQPVISAGMERLEHAEHLFEQEREARLRAEAAENEAAGVTEPPSYERMAGLGGLVVSSALGGLMANMGGGALWAIPIITAVISMGLLAKYFLGLRQARAEREKWQQTKETARASMAKLGNEMQALLREVAQSSLAEWRTAWREIEAFYTDLERAKVAQATVDETLSQRRLFDARIVQLLATVGIMSASAGQDNGTQSPWTAQQAAQFAKMHERYEGLCKERSGFPKHLEDIVWETERLVEEATGLRERFVPLYDQLRRNLDSEALEQLAVTQGMVTEAEGRLVKVELPLDLWPDTLAQVLYLLPSPEQIADWETAVDGVRKEAADGCARVLREAGVADLVELETVWEEHKQTKRSLEQARQVVVQEKEALAERLSELRTFVATNLVDLLRVVDVPVPVNPMQTNCGDLSLWRGAVAEVVVRIEAMGKAHQRLNAVRVSLAAEEKRLTAQATEKEKLTTSCQLLWEKVGVTSFTELQNLYREHVMYHKLEQEKAALVGRLDEVLDGATVEEVRGAEQERCNQWRRLSGQDKLEAQGARVERAALHNQLTEIEKEVQVAHDHVLTLRNDIRNHEQQCSGEEAASAALEMASEEHRKAQAAVEALALAMDKLREAAEEVHRQFAPQLNAGASRLLQEITAGRYGQLVVDETLDIKVQNPDFRRQVELTGVSHGTFDQIYLAFRLAAAEAIWKNGPVPPLLIDDAFVHYDDERLRQALRVVFRISQQAQVLFFTCRQREMEIIQALANEEDYNFKLIRLPGPGKEGLGGVN